MPLYEYVCTTCKSGCERIVASEIRDEQFCNTCDDKLDRQMAAPMGKMAGQVARGGGADRFVAETLGIRTSDLPPALRTPQEKCNG
jgi:putative FmdB family regulatory protein